LFVVNFRLFSIVFSILLMLSSPLGTSYQTVNSFTFAQDDLRFPIEVTPETFGTFQCNWSLRFYDMVVTPSGDTYTLGCTYSSQEGEEYRYMLVKWSDNATAEWYRRWTEGKISWGLGVTYRAGYIYTVGWMRRTNDDSIIFLMKWNIKGELIWKQESDWTGSFRSLRTAEIVVTPDDSIYIAGVAQEIHLRLMSILIKFNSVGQLTWNKTIGKDYLSSKIRKLSSGEIILSNSLYLTKMSPDGSIIWNRSCKSYSFDVSPLDAIYTFSHPNLGAGINISRLNEEGFIEWSYTKSITWEQWVDATQYRLTTAADDSAYVIFGIRLEEEPTLVMMKIGPDGKQLWNRSLIYNYGFPNGTIVDLGVSHSGEIIAGGIDFSSSPHSFAVAIYQIGSFTPLITTTSNEGDSDFGQVMVIVLIGGVISLISLIRLYQRRNAINS